jgi:hypothetical protein
LATDQTAQLSAALNARSISNTIIPRNKELKEDTVIIVLGASGDLAKKKTFPALFGLVTSLFLPHRRILKLAVPKQIPPKRHQDRWICQNEDGPQGVP